MRHRPASAALPPRPSIGALEGPAASRWSSASVAGSGKAQRDSAPRRGLLAYVYQQTMCFPLSKIIIFSVVAILPLKVIFSIQPMWFRLFRFTKAVCMMHRAGFIYGTAMALCNFLQVQWRDPGDARLVPPDGTGALLGCFLVPTSSPPDKGRDRGQLAGSAHAGDESPSPSSASTSAGLPLFYSPRWCDRCRIWRPPRSHHCRLCDRCILRMDHHCPVTSGCIGSENIGHLLLAYFFGFLILAYALSMHGVSWVFVHRRSDHLQNLSHNTAALAAAILDGLMKPSEESSGSSSSGIGSSSSSGLSLRLLFPLFSLLSRPWLPLWRRCIALGLDFVIAVGVRRAVQAVIHQLACALVMAAVLVLGARSLSLCLSGLSSVEKEHGMKESLVLPAAFPPTCSQEAQDHDGRTHDPPLSSTSVSSAFSSTSSCSASAWASASASASACHRRSAPISAAFYDRGGWQNLLDLLGPAWRWRFLVPWVRSERLLCAGTRPLPSPESLRALEAHRHGWGTRATSWKGGTRERRSQG